MLPATVSPTMKAPQYRKGKGAQGYIRKAVATVKTLSDLQSSGALPRTKLSIYKSPAWWEFKWVRVCLENSDREARGQRGQYTSGCPISRAEAVKAWTTGVEKGPHRHQVAP